MAWAGNWGLWPVYGGGGCVTFKVVCGAWRKRCREEEVQGDDVLLTLLDDADVGPRQLFMMYVGLPETSGENSDADFGEPEWPRE